MKRLCMWILPLLYLPNLGFSRETPFGILEISDFIIIPYAILLLSLAKPSGIVLSKNIIKIGIAFVLWAIVGSLMIYFFYDYPNPWKVITFSILKILKFTLYGTTAFLAARVFIGETGRNKFANVILICATVMGFSMVLIPQQDITQAWAQGLQTYKVDNLMSVTMAILICYISSMLLSGFGSAKWRLMAKAALVISIAGFSFSQGRGGWLACLAGMIYLVFRRGLKLKIAIMIIILAVSVFFFYRYNPNFKHQIELTFERDIGLLEKYNAGIMGINEGSRLSTWSHEIVKFWSSPVFGTGFHHRGSLSQLWATGSHNFWLQIFLETGLLGGVLILMIPWRMWRQANLPDIKQTHFSLPLKASLITVFVGGMSGEYFFGGMAEFTALLIYLPVGTMTIQRVKSHGK